MLGNGHEPASVFDSRRVYPGYAWTRDGHTVTPEELSTIAGPSHCGWQTATFLSIGYPPGTPSTSAAEARQYVRDPKGVTPTKELRDRLDLHATLRSDARVTGYVYNGIAVYLSPSDPDASI